MERKIIGKRPTFRPTRKGPNLLRIMILLALIMASIWLLLSVQRGQLKSPFEPTPTPTRQAESLFLEAEAYFEAGKLDDPSNAVLTTDLPPSTMPLKPTRRLWRKTRITRMRGRN